LAKSNNSLSKNIFQTFGAKAIAFVLAFCASAFVTRLLGPSGKGVQIFINTNVSLFTIILGLNINTFLLYYSAKEEALKKKAMGFALVAILSLFLIFAITFWTLKYFDVYILGFLIPDEYLTGIYPIYYTIFLFISLMGLIIQGYWKGSKIFKYINFMVMLAAGIKLVAYSIAYFSKKLGYLEMNLEQVFILLLSVMVLTFMVKAALFLFKSDLHFDLGLKGDLSEFIGFINLGYLTALLNFANKRVDLWFIEHYNTIEELGYYGLAVQLTNLAITFAIPATFVISPYLTKSNVKRRTALIGRFSRCISTVGLFMILFVVGSSRIFIPLFYGEEFIASILPLQVLVIGSFLLIFRNVFSIYNISQKNLKPNLYATIMAFIFTIILDFYWIPKYGIMGAAYASIIAYGVSCIIVFFSVYRRLDLKVVDYLFMNKSDVEFVLFKAKNVLKSRR